MSNVAKIKLDNISYTCKDSVARNPTFSTASSRTNIASGESLATLFGKIKKYFTDLKTVAFSGSYNDLSDQPSIPTITKYRFTEDITINANATYNYVKTTNHNSANVIVSSVAINGSYDVIPITWSYGLNDIYINLKNLANETRTIDLVYTIDVYS